MNILYDLVAVQPNQDGKYHGGAEYAKSVFKELVRNRNGAVIYGLVDFKHDLESSIVETCNAGGIQLLSTDHVIGSILKKYKIDRFYSALPYGFSAWNPAEVSFGEVEFFYTIHGLRSLEVSGDEYEGLYLNSLAEKARHLFKRAFPSWYKRRRLEEFKKLFHSAAKSRIIAVSNHTKASILNFFPEITADHVTVLYSPVKQPEYGGAAGEDDLQEKSYFLLVGGNRWIKNNLRAALAFDEALSEGRLPGKKVVIVGVSGRNIYRKFIKNTGEFIFKDFVDAATLESYYKNAYALVYPSLNEGFGYPPLEAMKYGTPALVASSGAIPEVCGDAVLYFNPKSTTEMKIRILQSLDRATMETLRVKSVERFRLINEKCEADLQKLVKMILEPLIGARRTLIESTDI